VKQRMMVELADELDVVGSEVADVVILVVTICS
jgi:hypothetical protein